jgi:hypothetical protein
MTPVSPGSACRGDLSGSNNVAHFSAGPNSDLPASRLTESLWCSDSASRRRFSVLPTFRFSIHSSAAFWKANLTGESSPFLKLDRWIIMINATPLFMSIQT